MPTHIELDYWVCNRYPWGCNIHHDTEEQAKNCSCLNAQNTYTAPKDENCDVPKLMTGIMGGIIISGSNNIDDEGYTKPKPVESYE